MTRYTTLQGRIFSSVSSPPASGVTRALGTSAKICLLLCCLVSAACTPRSWSGPVDDEQEEPSPRSGSVFQVRINEVMASDKGTLSDATGASSPWLELYNTADAPVDLSGVPLSDDRLAPEKWFFPAVPASVVPPGGYLVVFCDGEASRESELHASFTLRPGPVEIVLNSGSDLFFAEASTLGWDRTVGRFPDGDESITYLDVPTPGAANVAPIKRAASLRGDVDGDGTVDLTDAIAILSFLFVGDFTPRCAPVADANADGLVDVSDSIRLLEYLFLGGKPLAALSPEELAECADNQPPEVATRPIYYGYPGHAVELQIEATDADGDQLLYEALELPAGASLAEDTGLVRWTPSEEQLGPFDLTFVVSDEAMPPHRVPGRLVFQVHPVDACVQPDCEPERGCELPLVPLTAACCGSPGARVPDPEIGCPDGGRLRVGRNSDGAATIGRLVNCDFLSLLPLGQGGHVVRLNLEAHCLVPSPIFLEVRLETAQTTLIDNFSERNFIPVGDGFSELRGLHLVAEGLFAEGMEAHLTVRATDTDGVSLETTVRVVLTRTAVPDLP